MALGNGHVAGEHHWNWCGDDISYKGVRRRVVRQFGKASNHRCVDCGGPARYWTYDGTDRNERHDPATGSVYGIDVTRYVPRCPPCSRSGDAVCYAGMHYRIQRAHGPANHHWCVDCGEEAAQWSYDHCDPDERTDERGFSYSTDPKHYVPRCVSCHKRFDIALRKRVNAKVTATT